jgi:hypothetical protein
VPEYGCRVDALQLSDLEQLEVALGLYVGWHGELPD